MKTGRKMTLVRMGGIYFLRISVARALQVSRTGEVSNAFTRFLFPVRLEEQLASSSSTEGGVRSARKSRMK